MFFLGYFACKFATYLCFRENNLFNYKLLVSEIRNTNIDKNLEIRFNKCDVFAEC